MLIGSVSITSRVLLLLISAALLALAPDVAPTARAVDATTVHGARTASSAIVPRLDRFYTTSSTSGIGPTAVVTSTVSAGGFHSCGVKDNGEAFCWGYDGSNQVSDAPAVAYTQISAGYTHTCGLKSDSTAICWGENSNGQSTPPTDTLKLISAGKTHTCGIKSDGTELCWGDAADGRTAQQTGTFISISAGGFHTCGVKSDGTVLCWGSNTEGQTAQQTGTFTQVSAGEAHTCGLRPTGTIECWGRDDDGQIVPQTGTFTQVSAGGAHTCGLKTDGTILCWGSNTDNQSIAPSGTYTQVSAGGAHSCAVPTTGGFRCWGRDDEGQNQSFFKPIITAHPSSPGTITAGTPLNLQVVANGGSEVRYQWRKNTSPLPNQNSATLSIASTQLSDSGSFDVIVSNNMGSVASNPAVVTVTRLSQMISFDQPVNKRYGDAPFDFSAVASSGLPIKFDVISGHATINGYEMTITAAGTVVVRASQAGNGTYSPADSVEVEIEIARANLTIRADDQLRLFGQPNPELTATYEGLVNGDDKFDIDDKPELMTPATIGSPPGDYDIRISGVEDANYTITTVDGTLRIVRRLFYVPMVVRDAPFGH
jgi:hypothetical protein